MRWAIAIHGGAGAIDWALPDDVRRRCEAGLSAALDAGRRTLASGGAALDAVERAVRVLEDDPLFNAGRGAVFAADGGHALDASIMDGQHHACGAVAAVRRTRNPVRAARAVMERTRHVLLVGEDADAFAAEQGLDLAPADWFATDERRAQWQRLRGRSGPLARSEDAPHGTVGAVALDAAGHLAAATSTGGLVDKRPGRVGDSAVIGAGTWADDRTVAVSGTGHGEEFIRHAVAHTVSLRIGLLGESLAEATSHAIERVLRPGDGGLVAVDAHGRIAMPFSTAGMFRGAADAAGLFEVAIW